MRRAAEAIGTGAATFDDLAAMLAAIQPDTLIVCTRDDTHADAIVAALEAGVDVITEKPTATTAAMCRRVLDAEKRTGRRVDVAFNFFVHKATHHFDLLDWFLANDPREVFARGETRAELVPRVILALIDRSPLPLLPEADVPAEQREELDPFEYGVRREMQHVVGNLVCVEDSPRGQDTVA